MFEIISKSTGEVILPDSIINVVIVSVILTIFAIIVNRKVKQTNVDEVPSNFMNVVEMTVEAVEGLVKQTMGAKHVRFAPFIYSLMAFILASNLSGLIGLTPPTSNYSVTLTLALVVFVLTQFYNLKTNGLGGYVKSFFEPMAFLVPLNILGELANPISLSFRLFGNIISGVIIMSLVYSGLSSITALLVPVVAPALHAYLDLFSGALQTFIFGMLTMIFISDNLEQ